jgi:hypothetical protein
LSNLSKSPFIAISSNGYDVYANAVFLLQNFTNVGAKREANRYEAELKLG